MKAATGVNEAVQAEAAGLGCSEGSTVVVGGERVVAGLPSNIRTSCRVDTRNPCRQPMCGSRSLPKGSADQAL